MQGSRARNIGLAGAMLALALPLTAAMAAGGGGGGNSGGAGGGAAGGAGAGAGQGRIVISNDSNADAEFADAQNAIAGFHYDKAVSYLQDVLARQPDNPDVLNLMGFAKRKLGDQSAALDYYDRALALQPDHIGANEYLGELYLEMKDLAKAKERLAVLQQACGDCEEYNELKDKIAKFEMAAN